jgi:cytochrome c oxidase subunit 1
MRRGEVAEANPWECTTLEWTLNSPAPAEGFGNRQPQVKHGPYEYNISGAEKDFVMQDAPAS